MTLSTWKMDFMEHKGLQCVPPCSVYSVLLDNKLIQDPFYGVNEQEITRLSENDSKFYTEFTVTEELEQEYAELEFYGLDTVCDIFLNGKRLAHTENMHRKYTFSVKNHLRRGQNRLELYFSSPIRCFRERYQQHPLDICAENIQGAAHIRKAFYMSGWDWGPRLPDMGIFRDVCLTAYNTDKLVHTVIHQEHRQDAVNLYFDVTTAKNSGCDVYVQIDGQKVRIENSRTAVTVQNPKLWWVRGYGEQNLYDVVFTLEKDGKIVDTVTKRIGLRTLTVSTARLEDGNEFCFVNNGVKIFAMGANFIPQDNLYARITRQTTRQRIDDFLFANYNCIRIWGGGYYPEDYFFDLCDEEGLLVWEDFMVACANIWLSEKNEQEFRQEAVYNLSRISHHASLGIFCGNNEMELWVAYGWGNLKTTELEKRDYLQLYERILPEICKQYAPDTFYWPSSPSCGGGFDEPNAENRGDVHYWDVWHGSIPFENYRKHKFRFCSEYGFESFPNLKTINSFCEKQEQNPFSEVMENHQKCQNGNKKILMYLADKYLYPYSFADFVYLSQILQAEAIRLGVEHFRRTRGYCMGSIYWQANDCWPVASWSSVDYYGRYKALHYAARRFYAPVAHGIFKENGQIVVNVANETRKDKSITLRWGVCKNDNTVLYHGEQTATVKQLSAKDVLALSLEELAIDGTDTYFYADLYDENGAFLMRQVELFAMPKAFCWLEPELSVTAQRLEDGVELTFIAENFTKDILVDFASRDVILSDNYFSLVNGQPYRILAKTDWELEALLADMQIQCVNTINKKKNMKWSVK